MEYNELTNEEQELINNYRKNKSKLIIKNIIKDNGSYTEYKQIKFNIKNNIINISTKNAQYDKKLGIDVSSSGFFDYDLTVDDVERIQKYFQYYLS